MPFNLAYEGGPGEYKLGPSSPGGGEVRDKLLDVDKAIKGRLLEWETLIEQAVTNTKEQFYNSPDLDERTLAALMDALLPFTALSRHALEPNASAPRSSPSCAGRL